jgi:hypothetical protein
MLKSLRMWLRNVRNNLRFYWLVFLRDYKDATSTCYSCGRYGASVCSIMYPKRLCEKCSRSFMRRYHAIMGDTK